jgi:hypothetical protein
LSCRHRIWSPHLACHEQMPRSAFSQKQTLGLQMLGNGKFCLSALQVELTLNAAKEIDDG